MGRALPKPTESGPILTTPYTLELLQAYHWPGNVRQLRAVIESVAMRLTEPVIREKDVCQALPQLASVFGTKASKLLVGRYGAALIVKERDKFERALIESDGDRDKAALNMGLSRSTFYRRSKELGLVKERRRRNRDFSGPASDRQPEISVI